ncbi:PIN domain-containing protein [Nodosilinea nodulosa]|uniref:PIN domain-containing protein n=1 Tax=Nodosilinea nodulosa TaxID=416001 RepID=UPI0002EAB132|nr:PIN domain-containing protein [Nodosilinea nodulosa]
MWKILIDTCVWLDLAKDTKQLPILGSLEELLRLNIISLIVPRIILDEFQGNRERIAKESTKSLSTHFRLVKEAVNKLDGDKEETQTILSYLDDVNHKIPIIGGEVAGTLNRIEKLLSSAFILETSEAVKLRAAQRAIEKKAPFHRGKNSMADAIIIETYGDYISDQSESDTKFAFVTYNKSDFGNEIGNQKVPNSDFDDFFSSAKSLYFINLAEALRQIEPSLVTDIMLENSWMQEPRGLTEILEAEDLLFHQVWYSRHWNLRSKIRAGKIKIVDKEIYPRKPDSPETIQRNVLKVAIKAARRVERRYGEENLGPWDDFEWGMINGKLSALRWVLGDDWDMLDT